MTLEMHDDVAWDQNGTATELIQLKHHVNAGGGLGDASVDLWRTLNAWMHDGSPSDPYGPILTLVTTSTAADGSAAALLRGDANRDPERAVQLLEATAQTSTSQASASWRARFTALTPAARRSFLARAYVVDSARPVNDIENAVRELLWAALPKGDGAKDAFIGLLWRWWNEVSIDMLRKKRAGIGRVQLYEQIATIRNRFSEDSLPTLVELADVDEELAFGLHKDRVFVMQMEWVGVQPTICALQLLTIIERSHRRLSGSIKTSSTYRNCTTSSSVCWMNGVAYSVICLRTWTSTRARTRRLERAANSYDTCASPPASLFVLITTTDSSPAASATSSLIVRRWAGTLSSKTDLHPWLASTDDRT